METLGLTGIKVLGHLGVEAMIQSTSSLLGGLLHLSCLEGTDDCDITSCVLTCCPVGDDNISRPLQLPTLLCEEEPFLPGWRQKCLPSSLIDGIPEIVVPAQPLTLVPTSKSMVAKNITVPATGNAGTLCQKHRQTKSVFNTGDELQGPHVQTQNLSRYSVQPIA